MFPRLHAAVTAYATPALETAYVKAASRLPAGTQHIRPFSLQEYQESSWGVMKADNLTATCEPTVYKMWEP
jgi:hypothetical protein